MRSKRAATSRRSPRMSGKRDWPANRLSFSAALRYRSGFSVSLMRTPDARLLTITLYGQTVPNVPSKPARIDDFGSDVFLRHYAPFANTEALLRVGRSPAARFRYSFHPGTALCRSWRRVWRADQERLAWRHWPGQAQSRADTAFPPAHLGQLALRTAQGFAAVETGWRLVERCLAGAVRAPAASGPGERY